MYRNLSVSNRQQITIIKISQTLFFIKKQGHLDFFNQTVFFFNSNIENSKTNSMYTRFIISFIVRHTIN